MYPAFVDANKRYADQHSALYQNIMIDLVNMGILPKEIVNTYLDYNLPERYLNSLSGVSGVSGGLYYTKEEVDDIIAGLST